MFNELLSRIAESLTGHDLPYMIIGGQAVLVHGEPRLTKDIDLTVGCNIDAFQTVLKAVLSVPLKPLTESPEQFVSETMVLPCIDPNSEIRVDITFSISDFETQAIKRAVRIPIDGIEVAFAAVDDLIIHKIIAGRPRDLEDARILLLKHPELDMEYIIKWLEKFSKALDRDFTAVFSSLR